MLADHIKQQAGGAVDIGGMLSSMAAKIDKAQRFVLGHDAAEACIELMKSRPSNMIKAMPICRLPYKTMWVETSGGFSENTRDPIVAPIPASQGTLIDGFDSQRGCMTIAWVHGPTAEHREYQCNASPYGLWFDFSEDGDAIAMVRAHHAKVVANVEADLTTRLASQLIRIVCERIESRFSLSEDPDRIREFMRRHEVWARWVNDPHEVEALQRHNRHMKVGLSPHGIGSVLAALAIGASFNSPDAFARMMGNWEQDIEGEGPFGQFFLTLLNSKNCMTQAPVSMAKLNKARAKRSGNKPALLDYTTINLTMSPARARAGAASGLSREAMRLHLVRGHFKVRKTGVYWWNSFPRGDASKPAPERQRYEVA